MTQSNLLGTYRNLSDAHCGACHDGSGDDRAHAIGFRPRMPPIGRSGRGRTETRCPTNRDCSRNGRQVAHRLFVRFADLAAATAHPPLRMDVFSAWGIVAARKSCGRCPKTNGKELWATPLGDAFQQGLPQSKEGPSCTPTVDGDRLYVLGMGGNLACLQVADGKIVWQKNLIKDFGGHIPTWSYRESPLIDGEKLICTPGAEDATFMALNKMTGEVIWKSKLPDREGQGSGGGEGRGRGRGRGAGGAAYTSAIAIDVDGQRQYVQITATALVGIAASDGKFLWRYDKAANGNGINCTTPLFVDGMVFAASAYGAGGGLVKLSKDDNGAAKAEEVWFSKRMQNHHGGIVSFDGCLYGANGGLEGGALICLDFKTGEVLWDERSERRAPKGSIALADGRLYYRTEDGTLLLIEPSRKEYIERGRVEQPDRSSSPAWSHPVIANGKLYVRDQDLLFCYDVKAK